MEVVIPAFQNALSLYNSHGLLKALQKLFDHLYAIVLSAKFYKEDGINLRNPYNLLIRLRNPVMSLPLI